MGSIASEVACEGHVRPRRTVIADGALRALIAAKALIMLTTMAALAVPAMHEFGGEAMTGRVLVYAVAVLLIPAGWLACGRPVYPVAADSFLTVPLLLDLAGNSLHLYARFDHYDKLAHMVGVAAAAMFAAALLRRHVSGRIALAAVAVAGGLWIGIAIELFEFAVFTHPSASGLGAYQDTVGDLAMDMLGAAIAAVAILAPPDPVRRFGRRPSALRPRPPQAPGRFRPSTNHRRFRAVPPGHRAGGERTRAEAKA